MREKKSKYRVQGISFPNEAVYQAALAKATAQRRSLSNYICGLLEDDLKAGELQEDSALYETEAARPKLRLIPDRRTLCQKHLSMQWALRTNRLLPTKIGAAVHLQKAAHRQMPARRDGRANN